MQRATASMRRSLGLLHVLRSHGAPSRWTAKCCSSYTEVLVDVHQTRSDLVSNQLVQTQSHYGNKSLMPKKVQEAGHVLDHSRHEEGQVCRKGIGDSISSRDKNKFLIEMLADVKDSKEAVYGALDAWVAWERDFPIARLKRALVSLQKDGQWHRIIQVLKWMLSKGQGNTMGTYEQLILALDKDQRAEEAHSMWVRKISYDLHSVPWRVCELMISIYYRNNMLERLVKLFKSLEAYDRKPPKKSIVRKVSDACEILGLLEEKDRIMEKYNHLFTGTPERISNKFRRTSNKMKEKAGETENGKLETLDDTSASSCSISTSVEARAL